MSLREKVASLIVEWPRFEWNLRRGAWIEVRNRRERLISDASGHGFRCDWRWTSELRLPKSYPATADRLYRAAMRDWPIRVTDAPPTVIPSVARDLAGREAASQPPTPPDPSRTLGMTPGIAFVIPHKGATRTPNLLMTLKSIAAQKDVAVECVVVEQGEPESRLTGLLPSWVRHIVLRPPVADMPFNKSWLLNVGVRETSAPMIVIHDNDMLVPERYSAEVLSRGADVVDLKRFIFYLDEPSTRRAFETGTLDQRMHVEQVVQNLTAGGTMAVSREAYVAIGGYDESFYGWGGHDTDFWERALTRRVDPYGYLPILHLWHAFSAGKERRDQDPGVRRYEELEHVDPRERIAALHARPWGRREGPVHD